MAAGRIRVLIVEPRRIYAGAIAGHLGHHQFAVDIAHSEACALKLLRDIDPDVVLMCVGSEHASVEVFDRLRGVCTPPLIAVTDAEEVASAAPAVIDKLVTQIRRALRTSDSGETGSRRQLNPRVDKAVGDLNIDVAARRVSVQGRSVTLTRIEFGVLALLLARSGEVVSRRELQDALWGVSWSGNRYTLDMHVGNLRRKLGDDPTAPRYVRTVRGVGYQLGT